MTCGEGDMGSGSHKSCELLGCKCGSELDLHLCASIMSADIFGSGVK
jgi:hypothetical protein